MYWYKKYRTSHKKGLGPLGSLLSKVFVLNDLHFRANTDGDPNSAGAIHVPLNRYYYATPNLMRNFVKVANEEQPDHVFVLGDICDLPSDWVLFNDIWGGLLINSSLTIGNHDYDDHTYEQLLPILDYDSEPENAGSKFNYTFSLNGVRHIILDTTFNDQMMRGNHSNNIHVHVDTFDWMENILNTCDETVVLIGSHVGFHGHHFNAGQRSTMDQMVGRVLSNRPDLTITSVFGHHHVMDFEVLTNMSHLNGQYLPAMVLYEEGRFTELNIYENGFEFIKRSLPYEVE